jgi:hypothetical protein
VRLLGTATTVEASAEGVGKAMARMARLGRDQDGVGELGGFHGLRTASASSRYPGRNRMSWS